MSADNWAICPRCLDRTRRETIHEVDIETLRTFREDFDQGMDEDGTFSVHYKGGCATCGFSHAFVHTDQTAHERKENQ